MDRLEPAAPGRLRAGLAGEGLPLAGIDRAPAVGGRGPHDLRGGGDERPVARLSPAQRLLGVLLLGDVVVHLDHRAGTSLLVAVQDPVAGDLDPCPRARATGELRVPLAVLQQRGDRLLRRHRKLGVQQLERVGADRLLLGPAVQPLRARAPELDPAVEAAGHDRRMAQDLQQLLGLAHALAQRGAGGLLGLEQPFAQREVGLGPLGGAPLVVGAARHRGHPERGGEREPGERRDEERQHDVLLVEAQAQRQQAAGGEEQRDGHRDRQQPAQQDGPWVARRQQVDDHRLVGRGSDTRGQQEQQQRRHERGAEPGGEGVQLGHAEEVAHHGEQREHGREQQSGQVDPPVRQMPLVLGEQQRQPQQEEARRADRRGPPGKGRGDPMHVVGKEERVEAEVAPDEVFGENQRRHQDGEPGGDELLADEIRPQGQQAAAGQHEHEGGERDGRGLEGPGRDDGPGPEDVGLDRRDAESRRRGAGHDGHLPHPPREDRGGRMRFYRRGSGGTVR